MQKQERKLPSTKGQVGVAIPVESWHHLQMQNRRMDQIVFNKQKKTIYRETTIITENQTKNKNANKGR
jgi:hypothetical protein